METNTSKHFLFISLCSAFVAIALNATTLFAATYYFDPVRNVVGIDQIREVAVLVNTNGVHLNAFEGVIVLPNNIIEVLDIQTSDSIIDFWVEQPTYVENRISFSGIVPNGFDGIRQAYGTEKKSGILMRISYRGTQLGSEPLVFEDALAYKNDGFATPVDIDLVPAVVDVIGATATAAPASHEDTVSPELFVPYLVRDDALENGAYVVVFTTTDLGSDIDYYEVAETAAASPSPVDTDWVRATSPYVLTDQTGVSIVYVKAVDNAGNVRIVEAVPELDADVSHAFKTFPSATMLLSILITVLILAFVYIRRSRK